MSNGFRDFRERIGVKTQTKLAKILGIKPSNVSEWESGTGYPSYITMKKMFDVGATIEELFGVENVQTDSLIFLKQLSDRVFRLKESIQTEEATKNAFIMPFLQALGYDIFNPLEVVPEYTCDIGTKQGEKIDYAIFRDGEPTILVECKHWKQNLNLHEGQLLRYFHVSKAKFGILTNGIEYLFYSDLVEPNKISERLQSALNAEKQKDVEVPQVAANAVADSSGIVTTEEELDSFRIVKAILRKEIGADRMFYRDTQSYFNILLDDSIRKTICRLYFNNSSKKYIALFGQDGKENKIEIKNLDDIYSHSDALIQTALWHNSRFGKEKTEG